MLYIKSTRDGRDTYSMHGGMSEDTVRTLLTALGCSNIQVITQEEFAAAQGE